MSTVAGGQRFTRSNPCPICGGHDTAERGRGERCFGFLSDDGDYARCTREEYAGGLPLEDATEAYAHRLVGDCRCGARHGPVTSNGRVDHGHLAGHDQRKSAGLGPIVATYDYRDESGALLYQVTRHVPKDFRQRRPVAGGWVWGLDGVRRVPYRLPELLAADASETVWIAEGEKDVGRLGELGLVATCNSEGAEKWRPEFAEYLRGRRVVVVPDNDDAGRKHAAAVVRTLQGVAASVGVLELPGLGASEDVSDWLAAGGTEEQLAALVKTAEADTRAAGAALLDDVYAFLGRFVAYPSEHARIAHALWVIHAHLMDAWESTPRAAFLSPEPASGKTRALEATELLVPRPVEAVNVTPAYLFRKVDSPEGPPTILFDEIDTVFGPKAKDNEEIRGLLNAGHRRGAVAGRCVVRGQTVVTEEIPAYCAVALAGLGALPDTILSRSVVVRMRRRAPGEHVEPYRRRVHAPEGHRLRDRIAAWAAGVAGRAAGLWPEMPPTIEDRDADLWESLLTVADLAGGGWPERARVAAVALVADSKQSTPSLGIRLLSDLREVFGEADKMTTEAILVALCKLEEAPWAEVADGAKRDGKPLNARGLASYLRPYGVKSQNVRDGDKVAKGYTREGLADAWERYLTLPPQEPATSATSATDTPVSAPNGWDEAEAARWEQAALDAWTAAGTPPGDPWRSAFRPLEAARSARDLPAVRIAAQAIVEGRFTDAEEYPAEHEDEEVPF